MAATVNLDYPRARRLLVGAGLVVLFVVAVVAYLRGVDPIEVGATLLFIPVFLAALRWHVWGGLITSVLASVLYLLLRLPAIQRVGLDLFAGRLATRTLGFLVFGLLAGWAARYLESSLTKLEAHDVIDDATQLLNARFFVQDTELEISRARRYGTTFAVVVLELPAATFDTLSRGRRATALRELGDVLREMVRTVDRVVHARDTDVHRVAAILPETEQQGADILAGRLVERLSERLSQRGAKVIRKQIARHVLSYPDDEEELQRQRELFAAIDRREHPEAAEAR